MTRVQVLIWSLLLIVCGGGLLGYLLISVSPWLADGSLNYPLIWLFLAALGMALCGLGSTVALALQRRYPRLAGGTRYRQPRPNIALRQGFLFACAVVANALLAFFQVFDVIFLLAIPLLVGLLEAYLQHRPTK